MPLYNSSEYMCESIESVLCQSFKDFELIIVDDTSFDDSYSIALRYSESDNRIKVFKNSTNLGAAGTRNFGISQASNNYIAFIDSDDIWNVNKLTKQYSYMVKNNYSFTYTSYSKIDSISSPLYTVSVPSVLNLHSYLKNTSLIGCSSVMIDLNYFNDFVFSIDTTREDYSTWFDLLKSTDAHGLTDCLMCYRVYQGQSSSNKFKMALEIFNILYNSKRLSLFTSFYFFFCYLTNAFLTRLTKGRFSF